MNRKLHYQGGSSDKVYYVECIQHGGGWVVRYAYGRRGQVPLRGGVKGVYTSRFAAERALEEVYAEKVAKGYWDAPDVGMSLPSEWKKPAPKAKVSAAVVAAGLPKQPVAAQPEDDKAGLEAWKELIG